MSISNPQCLYFPSPPTPPPQHLLPALCSTPVVISIVVSQKFSCLYKTPTCCCIPSVWWSSVKQPWYSVHNILSTISILVILPVLLIYDAYLVGRATFQSLVALSKTVYCRLMSRCRTITYHWFTDTSFSWTLDPGQQKIMLDLWCILWILQMSLDKAIHLSTFKHLMSLPELTYFHPTLVVIASKYSLGASMSVVARW